MNSAYFTTLGEFEIKGVVLEIRAGTNYTAFNNLPGKSAKNNLPWLTWNFFVFRIKEMADSPQENFTFHINSFELYG